MALVRTDWTRATISVRLSVAHAVMSKWNATILGPSNSVHQNRIYSLRLFCGDRYPDAPPEIWFLTKVNLPCVSPTDGKVNPAAFAPLARWRRDYNLESVLVELRR